VRRDRLKKLRLARHETKDRVVRLGQCSGMTPEGQPGNSASSASKICTPDRGSRVGGRG
jgi:hypothetical protein